MTQTIRIVGRMPPTQNQSTIIYQSQGDDERFAQGNILLINSERFRISTRNPLTYAPNQTVILTLIRDRTTRHQRREQAALMAKTPRRNR